MGGPRTRVPVTLEADDLRAVHRHLGQHAAPLHRVSRFVRAALHLALDALEHVPADGDWMPDLSGLEEAAREVKP